MTRVIIPRDPSIANFPKKTHIRFGIWIQKTLLLNKNTTYLN